MLMNKKCNIIGAVWEGYYFRRLFWIQSRFTQIHIDYIEMNVCRYRYRRLSVAMEMNMSTYLLQQIHLFVFV